MAGSTALITANWLAFICLSTAFILLALQGIKYKGPGRDEKYYHGFREQNMLGMFINLFCALSYFAKILESMTDVGAGFAPFTTIRYLDYCFTCPLIALDMLWNMDAPYKVTLAILVLICLGTAVASANARPPSSYCWFVMGSFLFAGTYYSIIIIVQERLAFYVEMARDSNAKKSIKFLKTGCYIFFSVWLLYPMFWLLGDDGVGLVSRELDQIVYCVTDVMAKSAYGFALLYFRLYFDKKLVEAGVNHEDFKAFSVRSMQMIKQAVPAHGYGQDDRCFYPDEEEGLREIDMRLAPQPLSALLSPGTGSFTLKDRIRQSKQRSPVLGSLRSQNGPSQSSSPRRNRYGEEDVETSYSSRSDPNRSLKKGRLPSRSSSQNSETITQRHNQAASPSPSP